MRRAIFPLMSTVLLTACPTRDFIQNNSGTSRDDGNGRSAPARFFLPTGAEAHNTGNPRIVIDRQGGTHALYPAYAGGHAFYAYCAQDCDAPESFTVVELLTASSVHNAMLALTTDGKPRVLLTTMNTMHYATCDEGCTSGANWTVSTIKSHDGSLEVSGEAFALTPDGKPRYTMHGYRGYLGIGNGPQKTWIVSCEADCASPENWIEAELSESQVWEEATLKIDADGSMHLTGAAPFAADESSSPVDHGLYVECDENCLDGNNWKGLFLGPAYVNRYVENINPTLSLELTSDGKPRVAFLAKDVEGHRVLAYFTCDTACDQPANWLANALSDGDLGPGLDLVLSTENQPRIAYTVSYNILLARCDADCMKDDDASWSLARIELSSDMKPDEIFPYPNCNVAAWFLSRPSAALGADGYPHVVYRAEDISGGFEQPDDPDLWCRAGADMVFSRMTALSSWE